MLKEISKEDLNAVIAARDIVTLTEIMVAIEGDSSPAEMGERTDCLRRMIARNAQEVVAAFEA
jgi:hypothetical protein